MNDWKDLEKFTQKYDRILRQKGFRVTIDRFGGFQFNVDFSLKNQLSIHEHKYITLYFSKINNSIVLKIDNEISVDALKISTSKQKGTIKSSIRSKSFFNYYNINLEEIAGTYPIKSENILSMDGEWVIDLNTRIKK